MATKISYNRILDEHLHALTAQGNHEAYRSLVKRYRNYYKKLTSEILEQYPGTGIDFNEIIAICHSNFHRVIEKYNPQLSSFYSFWKQTTTREIMDYIIANSYGADAKCFKGLFILDDENDERIALSEYLHENERMSDKEIIKELSLIIENNKQKFENQELSILRLCFQGYTLSELEHTGMMKRSTLYLTFKNAVKKLKALIEKYQ